MSRLEDSSLFVGETFWGQLQVLGLTDTYWKDLRQKPLEKENRRGFVFSKVPTVPQHKHLTATSPPDLNHLTKDWGLMIQCGE